MIHYPQSGNRRNNLAHMGFFIVLIQTLSDGQFKR
jgi:hypothetical protein